MKAPKFSRRKGNAKHSAAAGRKNSKRAGGRAGAKQGNPPGKDRKKGGKRPDSSAAEKPNSDRREDGQSDAKVPPWVETFLAELQSTKNSSLPYERIEALAELSDTQLAIVFLKFKEILGRKLITGDFRKAIKETRARQRKTEAEDANRRRVGGQPYRISNGCMVRIVEKTDGAEIVPLANFVATITQDITEDDGVETKRFLGIEAQQGGGVYSFIIQASKLSSMEWAIENIGPTAIVNPNQRDWARAAVQSLSANIQEQRIFTHTGWRKVGDTSFYLHAAGAIGPAGAVLDVDVSLSGPLAHYKLALPSSKQELIEAIRASLRMIGLTKAGAEHITFVLLAAVYRACLKGCDFSIWIAGPTGVFKTEIAALAQQHYGPAMNSRRLPSSFASTANSLEVVAFGAKDALFVIDDFAPEGTMQDVNRHHASAGRILRAAGNSQGRGRLSSDARLREAKPPRGLLLVTAEDLPKGQSIRGRTFMIEIAEGDIGIDELTRCQVDAASGDYARALGAYVRHIAAKYDRVQAEYPARFAELRGKATRAHSRTPGIVADLQLGFELFLDFAVEVGAITKAERDDFTKRCWAALNKVARAQRVQQAASEPAHRFLELLRAAITSGDAHIASLDGGEPDDPAKWGWRTIGTPDYERWAGGGHCIGWLEGSDLYLEPTASYVVAQEIGRGTGEPLVVSETTLRKRLHEKKLLASIDKKRETYKVRKTVQGRKTDVLHLRASTLTEPPAPFADRGAEKEKFRC